MKAARSGVTGCVVSVVLAAAGCASDIGASSPEGPTMQPTSAIGASPSLGASQGPELPEAVVAAIPLDGDPTSIAADGDELWVADAQGAFLWRLSRDSGAVLEKLSYGPEGESGYFAGPQDVRVYAARGSVFVMEGPRGREVVRVAAETGEVQERIEVASPLGAAIADASLLVASFDPYEVVRIDMRTNDVVARIPSAGPSAVRSGFGLVWVLNHRSNTVSPIDLETNEPIAEIAVNAPYPERLGVGGGGVWVSSPSSDTVLRIDPDRMKVVATISVAHEPYDFAVGAGAVWVGTAEGVSRIDPDANQVTATVDLGPTSGILEFDRDGYLWAAGGGFVFKIDPTKV
ncbi:MAG TPA: hypothetical protein VE669_00460 [Actinomycetota bacterium]|nr:hypothetical protein [Actinomycetota bacterium]